MEIDRDKLNQIIQEEELRLIVRDALNENLAQVGKQVLIDTGVQVLTNMMASQDGREKLASILTALPDFFKKTVCRIDPQEAGPDSNIGSLSKACGVLATVAGAPLYGAAKLLPVLSDDEAAVVVDAGKKISAARRSTPQSQDGATPVGAETGPGNEVDMDLGPEEEQVAEITRPLPVYEDGVDAEILSTYEGDEDEEGEEELKEVREMIARNEARNERFRKLAGF